MSRTSRKSSPNRAGRRAAGGSSERRRRARGSVASAALEAVGHVGVESAAPARGESARRTPARGWRRRALRQRPAGARARSRGGRGRARPWPPAAARSPRACAPSAPRGRGSSRAGRRRAARPAPRRLDRRGPDSAEGMRSEPAVSVPVAAGTMRAASAAAEPPLDPPAERSSAHGLPTWSVVPPTANSCVCRWPSRTMPCPRSRAQTSQSTVRPLVEQAARRGQRLAGDAVEILEPDRDPPQRRERRCGGRAPSAWAAAASASSS